MFQKKEVIVLVVVMIVGQLSNAYRHSGKKIHVIHKGIPLDVFRVEKIEELHHYESNFDSNLDLVDLDNRLDRHDVQGVKEALRPELLTENRDERLMLQQNGIEDFDTIDATVEEEKPPPKPIEATTDEEESNKNRDLTDDDLNKKAEALPEYNVETRADFEGNQEAADWLTNYPNAYNLRSYEDTSVNYPGSMKLYSKDESGSLENNDNYVTNNRQQKASSHKHYKSQTVHKHPQGQDELFDKLNDNGQTLYSFGDLNLKDTEEEKASELEFTDNTNTHSYDASKYDNYENYGKTQDSHNFDESDIMAVQDDGDEGENKGNSSNSNKNDDPSTEEENAEENMDNDYENSKIHNKNGQNPKISKGKTKPRSKNEELKGQKFDTDGNKIAEGSGDTSDLDAGTGNSDASGANILNININSKTKSFRLGNTTVHIRLSDNVKDHKGYSDISDSKSTEFVKDKEDQKENDLSTAKDSLETSKVGHSREELSNSRHRLRKELRKVSHNYISSQGKDRNEYNKNHNKTTSLNFTSNSEESLLQGTDSKIELKELREELKSMEELMTLLQKNKEAKIEQKSSLTLQRQAELFNRSQHKHLVPMDHEETATRRKQESRQEDAHDIRFSEWNGWSECSVTCGKGVVIRARVCLTFKCPDKKMIQTKTCFSRDCPGVWERESLDAQNRLRARHHSLPLEWSTSLATEAQVLADQLAQKQFITLSDLREQKGENIAQFHGKSGDIAKRAAEKWYSEIKSYSFSYPKLNDETRHFVQMIWKETREIGMARARSKNGEYSFVVAFYNPPAVNARRLRENVLRPGNEREEDVYSTFRRSEIQPE